MPFGDGIKGGWILLVPLQGPTRRDPEGPALPHDLQRGGIWGPPDLGICGDSNGGSSGTSNRRFCTGHTMARRIILC